VKEFVWTSLETILTRGRSRIYLDCCMLLLHHTHNRQRDEDEDGATCIAMDNMRRIDEWNW